MRYVGKSYPIHDAVNKATGRAVYAGDMELKGMLHAAVLFSKILHGIVKKLDCSKALELPGVFRIPKIENYFKGQGIRCIFWGASSIIVLMKLFNSQLPFMVHPQIDGTILKLGSTVFVTIAVAGTLVSFIIESGIVEFAGTLLEPLMRPLFKLPGAAAVNCLSSYVVSAAVGVYMTDQYYDAKVYNRREAIAAATCFSTISVGYVGVLCSLGNMNEMYGTMLVLTFVLMIVMTAITVRIPPLSRIPAVYVDGTTAGSDAEKADQAEEDDAKQSRFQKAVTAAAIRSREFTMKEFVNSFLNALKFSQRIIAYMIPIVIVTLSLVHLTPLFTLLGKPIDPVLSLLGLPDAAKVAPAVLLGFIEVSLPAISVSTGVAAQSVFFVILLSIVQIIFMTEAGNAMLGANFKVSRKDLIIQFLVRTVIAVPIVARILII